MEIVIVGLGLIGGSIAKALKLNTPHRVLGMDISDDTLLDACSCGAIDGKAIPSDLEKADLVYLSIYPEDILGFVRRYGKRLKPGWCDHTVRNLSLDQSGCIYIADI